MRRSAGPLSPPTQIGGCGFCTGLGSKQDVVEADVLAGEAAASALVQSSMKALMYSSVTLPRSAKSGAWIASNSSFIQPAPMPSVSRPPDSTSMVESILAVSTAGRCGTTITEVTSRSLLGLGRDERHLDQLLVPFAARPGGEFTGVAVGVFGVRCRSGSRHGR